MTTIGLRSIKKETLGPSWYIACCCKQEDLNSESQHPHTKQSLAMTVYKAPELKSGRSTDSWIMNMTVSQTDELQILKDPVSKNKRRHLTPTTYFYMQMHIHSNAHMQASLHAYTQHKKWEYTCMSIRQRL